MKTLAIIRSFASEFCTSSLYDTGYGDAVSGSGMRDAETAEDMINALSYMTGYAHGARLACTYMTTRWQIAHLMGIAAATLRIHVQHDDADRAANAITTYRAELSDMLAKLSARSA